MEILKRLIGRGEEKKGSLYGLHAVVTGGGRGIGFAIARALAQRGADVALLGRNLERLRAAAAQLGEEFGGRKFFVTSCDVTDRNAIKSAFLELRESGGGAGILINCAGAVETLPFLKSDATHWARMLEVNLLSAVHCTHEVLPQMVQAGFGRVINIASTASLRGYEYISAYCAAKHAVVGFTKALALEVVSKGVTVNAVCPGFTDTDLLSDSVKKVAQKTRRTEEEIRKEYLNGIPLGRFIKPEEVASTVGWLCEKEQGAITGESIVIAGGEVH